MEGSTSLLEVNKERITKVIENLTKNLTPSRRDFAILGLIGVAIYGVTMLHGVSETWAWEIAKALINPKFYLRETRLLF